MIVKITFFFIIFLSACNSRRYVSLAVFMILISIGPLLKNILYIQSMSSVYFIYFSVFFIGVCFRKISFFLVLLASIIFSVLILQLINNNINIEYFSLGITQLFFLPVIAYYASRDIVKNNVDIFSVFIVYIMINYTIFYIRAFFNYGFYGILDVSIEEWMYRPSNFSSPIIFAIEVALLLSLMFKSSIHHAYKLLFIIISIIPLVLMESRSSYLIIFINFFFYLLEKRKISFIFYSSIILFLIGGAYFYTSGKIPYVLTLFDYEAGAYSSRLSSIFEAIDFITELGVIDLLVGLGAGSTSQYGLANGMGVVYVENGFISIIIQNGLLVFFGYALSVVYYVVRTGLKGSSAYLFVVLMSLLFVNIFSANLTVMSVSVLYWIIYFYGLFHSSSKI